MQFLWPFVCREVTDIPGELPNPAADKLKESSFDQNAKHLSAQGTLAVPFERSHTFYTQYQFPVFQLHLQNTVCRIVAAADLRRGDFLGNQHCQESRRLKLFSRFASKVRRLRFPVALVANVAKHLSRSLILRSSLSFVELILRRKKAIHPEPL